MSDQPSIHDPGDAPFDLKHEPDPPEPKRRVKTKRPWKYKLLEFGLWALLSLVTAVVLVLLSDELLPTNF